MNFKKIEDGLNHLLQRDIVIYNNLNKPLKKGKFLLYTVKEFYYVLTLQNEKGDLKEYELPVPFNSNLNDDHLNFDYTLDTFSKNNTFVFYKAKVLNYKKKSKLYNTIVVLSAIS